MRPQCYFIIYNETDSLSAQRRVTFNRYLFSVLRSGLLSLSLKAGGVATGHEFYLFLMEDPL